MIAEILIESLPQSLLQGFVYVTVVKHTQAGTASAAELAAHEFVAGATSAQPLRECLARKAAVAAAANGAAPHPQLY